MKFKDNKINDHKIEKSFEFTDEFLKNRSNDIFDLEKKVNTINFSEKNKYRKNWKEKYFDDFDNYYDLVDFLETNQKTNSFLINAKKKLHKEEIIIKKHINKDIKIYNKRKIDEIEKLKHNSFFEIGENIRFLNSKIIKKINSGEIDVDFKIDLHNMEINNAYESFLENIIFAYENHKRLVLVITGKGYGSGKIKSDNLNPKYKNISIKESIIKWINSSSILLNICLYINYSSKKDGGDGAFYIYLK